MGYLKAAPSITYKSILAGGLALFFCLLNNNLTSAESNIHHSYLREAFENANSDLTWLLNPANDNVILHIGGRARRIPLKAAPVLQPVVAVTSTNNITATSEPFNLAQTFTNLSAPETRPLAQAENVLTKTLLGTITDTAPISLAPSKTEIKTAQAIDITPPTAPIITNDTPKYSSGAVLYAYWTPSSDPESGIVEYRYTVAASADGSGARVVNYLKQPDGSFNYEWASFKGPLLEAKSATIYFPNSLPDKTKFYFLIKAKNGAGLWSNTAASPEILIDATQSSEPKVTAYLNNSNTLTLKWEPAVDQESEISKYEYTISTYKYGRDVLGPLEASKDATSATKTGLILDSVKTYYATLIAYNGAGIQKASSEAILVDKVGPTLEITSPQEGRIFKE